MRDSKLIFVILALAGLAGLAMLFYSPDRSADTSGASAPKAVAAVRGDNAAAPATASAPGALSGIVATADTMKQDVSAAKRAAKIQQAANQRVQGELLRSGVAAE